MRQAGVRWALAGGIVLLCARSRAETCPVPEGASPGVASIDASLRVDFLRRTADDQAVYAGRWRWWWVGIGSATFATSLGATIAWAAAGGDPAVQQANVIDNAFVSALSLVTPLGSLLFPLRVASDAPTVDRLADELGGALPCLALARIEQLLARDAQEEALRTGWLSQVVALLGLGAMFSVLAVEAASSWTSNRAVSEFHWINAGLDTGAGLILTEAQILTSPTGAIRSYGRYLRGELDATSRRPSLSVGPMPAATGVMLRLSY